MTVLKGAEKASPRRSEQMLHRLTRSKWVADNYQEKKIFDLRWKFIIKVYENGFRGQGTTNV